MPPGPILVVDDEAEFLRLIDIELTAEGYDVLKAKDAREALTLSRQRAPALILMDILLPDMSGAEAVQILKEDPKTRNIPVIFLSAILSKQEEKKRIKVQIGGHRYPTLAKPLNHKELLKAVRQTVFP